MEPSLSVLRRLVAQEQISRSQSCENIMEQTSPSGRHKNIHNPIWRQMIVDWCYQIIDHIGADRELVYITMNILDRFLAAVHFLAKNKKQDATTPTLLPRSTASSVRTRNYLTDKKAYETAVMTSLLITMKLQGLSSLCITDLVQMSSNSVTSKDIIEVGKEIISILSWNRKIPTAARFVHEMVHLLPDSVDERTKVSLYEMSVFQVELSIQDESCSHHPPSLVAWMSLENAMDDMSVPKYIRAIVRRTISKELGHEYNYFLRTMLYKFQNYNHFLCGTSSPAIIPPDDDEEEEENDRIIGAKNNYLTCSPSDDLLLLNLKSRPTFQHANGIVISMEDLSDISSSFMPPSQQRSQQDIVPNVIARNDCSSPRKTSKRIRVS